MIMADVIVLLIVALAAGGAVRYTYKSKKRGRGCMGCPYKGGCSGGCSLDNKRKK